MTRRDLNLKNLYQILRRFSCSGNESQIRVRFAPSPTGFLHLGGLRTALYNYLFAKATNGNFILRIEDTDQSRLVANAASQLENDLRWAEIHPDESPTIGGSYGPYIQSQRLPIYQDQVELLLQNGSAYPCFCSERRLDLLRKEALRLRQIPRYDNRCRNISSTEAAERIKNGDEYCVRFKLIPGPDSFDDLVYGKISFDVTLNEGDPVIIKTDRYPTYHFANVVDDHFMEITHVLRGVEWQISTTKHIALYRAFGWKPPQFAHLPLILNQDGSKLSKRQGDIHICNYKTSGIFPLALLNYITHASGGFSRGLGKPELLSFDELISKFNLLKINSSSCRLMPELLSDFNRLELKRQIQDEAMLVELVQQVKQLVSDKFQNNFGDIRLVLDDFHIRKVLNWSQERIHRLTDLLDSNFSFLWVAPGNISFQDLNVEKEVLQELVETLKQEDKFNKENLNVVLKKFTVHHKIPFGKFMKNLRCIITGLKEGPGVAEMMEILGQVDTLHRINAAISPVKNSN